MYTAAGTEARDMNVGTDTGELLTKGAVHALSDEEGLLDPSMAALSWFVKPLSDAQARLAAGAPGAESIARRQAQLVACWVTARAGGLLALSRRRLRESQSAQHAHKTLPPAGAAAASHHVPHKDA